MIAGACAKTGVARKLPTNPTIATAKTARRKYPQERCQDMGLVEGRTDNGIARCSAHPHHRRGTRNPNREISKRRETRWGWSGTYRARSPFGWLARRLPADSGNPQRGLRFLGMPSAASLNPPENRRRLGWPGCPRADRGKRPSGPPVVARRARTVAPCGENAGARVNLLDENIRQNQQTRP